MITREKQLYPIKYGYGPIQKSMFSAGTNGFAFGPNNDSPNLHPTQPSKFKSFNLFTTDDPAATKADKIQLLDSVNCLSTDVRTSIKNCTFVASVGPGRTGGYLNSTDTALPGPAIDNLDATSEFWIKDPSVLWYLNRSGTDYEADRVIIIYGQFAVTLGLLMGTDEQIKLKTPVSDLQAQPNQPPAIATHPINGKEIKAYSYMTPFPHYTYKFKDLINRYSASVSINNILYPLTVGIQVNPCSYHLGYNPFFMMHCDHPFKDPYRLIHAIDYSHVIDAFSPKVGLRYVNNALDIHGVTINSVDNLPKTESNFFNMIGSQLIPYPTQGSMMCFQHDYALGGASSIRFTTSPVNPDTGRYTFSLGSDYLIEWSDPIPSVVGSRNHFVKLGTFEYAEERDEIMFIESDYSIFEIP